MSHDSGTQQLPHVYDRQYWDDPRVQAAAVAEHNLYRHYDLEYTEHYVPVPKFDAHVRVLEVGSGDPVVAIPGGVGTGITWAPLLPELDGFRILVVDRFGAGFSERVDMHSTPTRTVAVNALEAVLDVFELDEIPLVANWMGGLWALRFAIEDPTHVSSLTLPGCPYRYPETTVPVGMRLAALPVVGGLFVDILLRAADADGARRAWRSLGHPDETRQSLPDEFAEAWYRMDQIPHVRQTWSGLLRPSVGYRGIRQDSLLTGQNLKEVSAPVLQLWGDNDPFGSVKQGRRGAEQFPDGTFHEVGSGHLPWLDEPEDCGQLLCEFLSRHA